MKAFMKYLVLSKNVKFLIGFSSSSTNCIEQFWNINITFIMHEEVVWRVDKVL